MDAILPFIGQWGPGGILAFVCLAVLKGWLVPRSVMDERVKEAFYQRDIWKEASQTKDAIIEKKEAAASAQVETARILEHLILSLKKNVEPPDDGGRV